ncbi:fibulin-2-like [Archocentrus centrarchus]|uniref:fibulin-2-like n=1 Tax=Archocentrus centrarchus TaxID=63155 RepID=UPI0011E9F30E|nr:fibulin-2-like [Archocentrus centrarchus]
MAQAEVALLRCALFFLYLRVCLSQLDCTGTDCPLLDNCIEEVLESGACCATCLQKGCACEGYQYYDCISAGFKNGKVPEGDSYFVDYGSTECSCPAGGGRISCHFISCPDIPPNCIEVSEPADGCMQCERVGCVHAGQKYEAGHSFHIDVCRVCHCPNEGGKLMCYPVPDCDAQKFHNPMLATPTEDNTVIRHDNFPYRFDQQGHTEQFATPYHLPNGNLPLFKLPPLKEEPEDYDYGPTDSPESYPQSLVFPTTSSPSFKKGLSVSQGSAKPDRASSLQSFDRQGKQALRERYGVHDHPSGREEVTEGPLRLEQIKDVPYTAKTVQQERSKEDSESSIPTSIYDKATIEPATPSQRWPESLTTPVFHFITTTQPPMRVKLDESQPRGEPDQMLLSLHSEGREEAKEGVKEAEEHRPVLLIRPEEAGAEPDICGLKGLQIQSCMCSVAALLKNAGIEKINSKT